MEIPSKQDIITLMEERGGPHVSLYMPTRRAGPETRENPIRFKNLLTEAKGGLIEAGMRGTDADDMLAPLAALEHDIDFWQHQADGLAIFVNGEGVHRFQVPRELPELALVQPRFHLKPLLPLLSADTKFHVLAISANSTRVLACTPVSQTEVKVEDLPDGIVEALWSEDPEKQTQFHSFYAGESGGTSIMHGAASNVPDHKDELLRYFHQVDRAMTRYMNEHGGPLILACVDYLAPIYGQTNEYNGLMEAHVTGSPDRAQDDDLRAQAWELLRPEIDAERERVIERYRSNVGTGLASSNVSEAALAAMTGKVDTVFVTLDKQVWGRIDAEAYKVEPRSEPEPDDYDLLDTIAAHTLMNSGRVYAVEESEAPEASGVAAIFRYA